MKHWKALLALLAAGLLLAACAVYVNDYYPADEAALACLTEASGVRVMHTEGAVAFLPEEAAETGFIFYPGGKVEHTAYAPLMQGLAEAGVLCVLPEMPLRLAVLDMHAADGVPEAYPQVQRWYVGGHSLGGSMAASHAAGRPGRYEGLVLLAAYTADDLQDSGLRVISLYGSEDGVMNREKYAESLRLLPRGYEEHVLAGGCHAGFGSYGPQAGDGTPALSGEAQLQETIRLLTGFLIP